jgi:hypothetical protein
MMNALFVPLWYKTKKQNEKWRKIIVEIRGF